MSLFSVVQNRIPPPPPQPEQMPMEQPQMAAPSPATHVMPDGSQMAGPPMQGPSVPADPTTAPNGAPMPGFYGGGAFSIPGYHAGGQHNLDGSASDGSHGVPLPPGYSDEPMGPELPDTSGAGGDSRYFYLASKAEMGTATDAELQELSSHMARREQEDFARASSGGGASGPDHFYEQMAEDARIRAEERRDAMRVANIAQQSEAEAAQQNYIKDMLAVDADRKQLVNTAIGQAQDTASRMISQAAPGGEVWFNPQQPIDAMKNTKGPSWAAPVVPKTVFPEGW